jgi:hypothetical protein
LVSVKLIEVEAASVNEAEIEGFIQCDDDGNEDTAIQITVF